MAITTVAPTTCLGCGCACDDIAVVVRDERIVEARNACPLGVAWFGDGRVPGEVRSGGERVSVERALEDAVRLLRAARRVLVYLAPDISCEAQRAAVGVADALRGVVDGVSSSTVAAGILAGQRRGRVAATLGEIRNRADLLIFWGTDPAERYPRYQSRYAPEPAGVFVPEGRRGRTVVAVDIGDQLGPSDADARLSLGMHEELEAIALLRATLAGRSGGAAHATLASRIAPLAQQLTSARYSVIVYDAEPKWSIGVRTPSPDGRAESLTALAQQLSATSRCSLSALRAGGNRSGAEAVLTWQTGFPMTVDFSRGVPRYRPDDGAEVLLNRGEIDAALIVGNPARGPALGLASVRCVAIGPYASELSPPAEVAVDTGVAGIHEGGMAFRMDDIPLPLRPSLAGPPDTAFVVSALGTRLQTAAKDRP